MNPVKFKTGYVSTLETIKSMILDFQELILETSVPRNLKIELIAGKASIIIGVRRSGKSTYLFQMMEKLVATGVDRRNILYINFFDDRLHELSNESLGVVTEAYYSLYPEKKNSEKIVCFFDEIQAVSGWEPFVDRLMRTEKCDVVLSGSSARMLSKEIATQMRGRALSWEIFPFSFSEFLEAQGVEYAGALSTKKRLMVQKAFEAYWEIGGFPEVRQMSSTLRTKTHQEYFQAILFRDLVERHDISHPRAVSDLSHWLIDNTASLYSINRLMGYLKSLGHKLSKSSVSDYMEWFEDAYFLFSVRIFDASLARSQTNPKKIYCIDHALVTSVSSGVLTNAGHLLENLCFMALRRKYSDIFYYKTHSGKEVDFIVSLRGKGSLLVQVTLTLADPKTQLREFSALEEAMLEMNVNVATIVTMNEFKEVTTAQGGRVNIIPAWKFLIDLDAME